MIILWIDFDNEHIVVFPPRNPTPYSNAHYGEGIGPVWMDDLKCTGKESDLESCSFNGWGLANCEHGEDAGVNCGEQVCI